NAYVFSIVSHIVDKASDAPGQVYRVTDDVKSKQWKMLTKDNHDFMSVMKARVLKAQAFEEVEGHEFIKLLEKPNPLQTGKQMKRELMGYHEITGNGYLYVATPGVGINGSKPSQLWVVPSPAVNIVAGTRMAPVAGYKVNYYEIGRAACRERVESTVVAASSK